LPREIYVPAQLARDFFGPVGDVERFPQSFAGRVARQRGRDREAASGVRGVEAARLRPRGWRDRRHARPARGSA
jgi:hypothetical protein